MLELKNVGVDVLDDPFLHYCFFTGGASPSPTEGMGIILVCSFLFVGTGVPDGPFLRNCFFSCRRPMVALTVLGMLW